MKENTTSDIMLKEQHIWECQGNNETSHSNINDSTPSYQTIENTSNSTPPPPPRKIEDGFWLVMITWMCFMLFFISFAFSQIKEDANASIIWMEDMCHTVFLCCFFLGEVGDQNEMHSLYKYGTAAHAHPLEIERDHKRFSTSSTHFGNGHSGGRSTTNTEVRYANLCKTMVSGKEFLIPVEAFNNAVIPKTFLVLYDDMRNLAVPWSSFFYNGRIRIPRRINLSTHV